MVIDSTRFSEVVNQTGTLYRGQSITINGSGKARVFFDNTSGWFEVTVDGTWISTNMFLNCMDGNYFYYIPEIEFSKSLQIALTGDLTDSAYATTTVTASLRNDVSIGGAVE